MADAPFHLAFPVHDLEEARAFYVERLGAQVGREDARWIDFDFWGHQITAHLVEAPPRAERAPTNEVDDDDVPARHFGVILPMGEWEALAARLREQGTAFVIEPRIRFRGQVGEQATMFLKDPSGNVLEFKSFRDLGRIFAR